MSIKPPLPGGFLCMPRCENVPDRNPGWKKVSCPACGDPCWQRPDDEAVAQLLGLEQIVCTTCALKKMGG